jgi:hypothetical protein
MNTINLKEINSLLNHGILKPTELDELFDTWRASSNPPMSKSEFALEDVFINEIVTSEHKGTDNYLSVLDLTNDPYYKLLKSYSPRATNGKIMPFRLTPDELHKRWTELKEHEHFFLTHTFTYPNDPDLLNILSRLNELDLIDYIKFPETNQTDLAFALLLVDVKNKRVWNNLATRLLDDLISNLKSNHLIDVVVYQSVRNLLLQLGLTNHPFVETVNRIEIKRAIDTFFKSHQNYRLTAKLMAQVALLNVGLNENLIEMVKVSIGEDVDTELGYILECIRFDLSYKVNFDEVINHWLPLFESDKRYNDGLERTLTSFNDFFKSDEDDIPF